MVVLLVVAKVEVKAAQKVVSKVDQTEPLALKTADQLDALELTLKD